MPHAQLNFVLCCVLSLITFPAAHATGIQVNLVESRGFEGERLSKLHRSLELLERVFASDPFRAEMLGFRFQGRPGFANADGLTNKQVLEHIHAAQESYHPVPDGIAQLYLNLYTPPYLRRWATVGYTYPDQADIFMNAYYFDSFREEQIAGNVAHEWMHKLGFDHDFRATTRRPYSVPYAVGEMVVRIGRALRESAQ